MKKLFATSFTFAMVSAMLFVVPGTVLALNGACECQITEPGTESISVAARNSDECHSSMSDRGKTLDNCSWRQSADPAVGDCVCTNASTKTVTQQVRQVPDRQACNTGAAVGFLQLNENQRLKSCVWVGEDPQLEQGQVFDPRLRNEIKALDKFGGRSIQQVIGLLIKSAMGVMGSIALVMFIYGGVMWMTSMGNSHKEDEGKDTVMWAAIGIAVILSSYALVTYLFASIAP